MVIYMRTYYLFIIKDEFYLSYLHNPLSLYKTLENLYHFTIKDFRFGVSLYHQLCEPHKVDILKHFCEKKNFHKRKNRYLLTKTFEKEKTILEIRPSVLILYTNRNIPTIFNILHYYSSRIFVCDFKNKDYFWLSNQYKKRHKF